MLKNFLYNAAKIPEEANSSSGAQSPNLGMANDGQMTNVPA
jgi:hypothetical protein